MGLDFLELRFGRSNESPAISHSLQLKKISSEEGLRPVSSRVLTGTGGINGNSLIEE